MVLHLTGERTVPGVPQENYWFRRHEAAYRWVTEHCAPAGAVVVDAGSGEGYGADMLHRSGAAEVIALEYDESAAAHCAHRYPKVATLRANLDSLPLPDASVDLLVTMQVIEHLWDTSAILDENSGVGLFLKTLFGYNANPSLTEVIAYLGFFISLIIGLRYAATPVKQKEEITA